MQKKKKKKKKKKSILFYTKENQIRRTCAISARIIITLRENRIDIFIRSRAGRSMTRPVLILHLLKGTCRPGHLGPQLALHLGTTDAVNRFFLLNPCAHRSPVRSIQSKILPGIAVEDGGWVHFGVRDMDEKWMRGWCCVWVLGTIDSSTHQFVVLRGAVLDHGVGGHVAIGVKAPDGADWFPDGVERLVQDGGCG
ncbi:hypothetical protein I7I50_01286 [Histoplasma capsulatum G186AR]|uniref:Uncharacterized protein n=1 Tax=Ajellomyces capsulatus TaxID=5037 RepID=A0A8H8D213_AJECA|nr:hypothetical protein I7I52_08887 [Histoplasma capsulatum]QSS73206.1 hypothetical protein I7I50_01286 [Histoplasma capsulatum G186AR]